MMKLKCIIADDEPVARRLLQEYIGDIDFLELKASVENALKVNSLLKSEPVDLLFLDINMPKLSGIEFLRTATSLPMVIMTTAYAEYARDGFDLDVLDYLLKPISFQRFLKAVEKAKHYYATHQSPAAIASRPSGATEENDHIFVKTGTILKKIFYDDILFAEAQENYVAIHTTGEPCAEVTGAIPVFAGSPVANSKSSADLAKIV